MTDNELWLRGLLLAFRDMCEDNAGLVMSMTFRDASTLIYRAGTGATFTGSSGHRLEIPESALDVVALVPADGSESKQGPA